MNNSFSDYIVYVDESGDHGLETFDREYPVFVLAFCVFQKSHYLDLEFNQQVQLHRSE